MSDIVTRIAEGVPKTFSFRYLRAGTHERHIDKRPTDFSSMHTERFCRESLGYDHGFRENAGGSHEAEQHLVALLRRLQARF